MSTMSRVPGLSYVGRQLDQRHHLQGVEVVWPYRENGRVKPFRLRETPLLVQLKRLREDLRHIGLQPEHGNAATSGLSLLRGDQDGTQAG